MLSNFAFLDFGTPELIIILAIVLLLFGGKKLPELSKSLGESMRELRKGLQGDINENTKETTASSQETKV
jgi:sec-independent protein translocase protein TatA